MKHIHLLFTFILIFPLLTVSQTLTEIDEIAPFSEGLAAVRKGTQWGFINNEGTLVIDFRDDLVWNKDTDTSKSGIKAIHYPSFKDGRCIVKKLEDEIPIYGFMDTKGKIVIEPQFLNVYPFDQGYTTGIIYEKVLRGENEFKLKIYDYKFHEVIMDTSGKILEYLAKPDNIQMTKRRYKLPWLRTKLISKNLVAIRTKDNRLEIRKLNL